MAEAGRIAAMIGLIDAQARWYADHIPLRGQVVADVGANVGHLSQFFWDASGGTSRVVSIEPLPENVQAIRERIRAAATDKWTVEPCAVSTRKGMVGLAVFRTPQGEWNSRVAKEGTRKVPCRPLSAVVPDATVVKIDIEGHEYGVLEEALPRLAGVHTWAVELHRVPDRPLQLALGAFMAHGYRVYASTGDPRDPQGPWISTEILATLDWTDVPVARRRADGSEFKMLHILAQKVPA
jgi:FkbM family methyltransferase